MLIYSKISAILCVLYFLFLHFFYLILENMSIVNLFYLLYSTLVTSWIIDPILCCHLFYLVIYLVQRSLRSSTTSCFFYLLSNFVPVRGPRIDGTPAYCTLQEATPLTVNIIWKIVNQKFSKGINEKGGG